MTRDEGLADDCLRNMTGLPTNAFYGIVGAEHQDD